MAIYFKRGNVAPKNADGDGVVQLLELVGGNKPYHDQQTDGGKPSHQIMTDYEIFKDAFLPKDGIWSQGMTKKPTLANIKAHKEKSMRHFIATTLPTIPTEARPNIDTLVWKLPIYAIIETTLLVADFDGVGDPESFETRLNDVLGGYNYFAYETLNNGIKQTEKGMRCRVVVDIDRPMNDKQNKMALRKLARLLDAPHDGLNDNVRSFSAEPVSRYPMEWYFDLIREGKSPDEIKTMIESGEVNDPFWTHEGKGIALNVLDFIEGEQEPIEPQATNPEECCDHHHDFADFQGSVALWMSKRKGSEKAFMPLWLHCRWWVKQGMMTKEIAEQLVIQCAEGNKQWEEDGLKALEARAKMPDNYLGCPLQFFKNGECYKMNGVESTTTENGSKPRKKKATTTEGSGKKKATEVEAVETVEQVEPNLPVYPMKDPKFVAPVEMPEHNPNALDFEMLINRVNEARQQWMDEHKEVVTDEDGNETIKWNYPDILQQREIMMNVVTFFRLYEGSRTKLATLAFWNPQTGLAQMIDDFVPFARLCKSLDPFMDKGDMIKLAFEIELKAPLRRQTKNPNLAVLKNVIYDREKREFINFSPKYILTSKIDTKYVPNAEEPTFIMSDGTKWRFTEWLDQLCADPDPIIANRKMKFWHQIFAHLVMTNMAVDKNIWFYSEKGNTGKGTMQELLKGIAGNGKSSNGNDGEDVPQNWEALTIKDFEKDFKLAAIYGKPLVVGDDNNPNDFSKSNTNLKSVSTGDGIQINDKNEKVFSAEMTPLIIQSMNGFPRFKDMDDGLLRRIRIFVFPDMDGKRDVLVRREFVLDKRLHEFIVSRVLFMDDLDVIDLPESTRLKRNLEEDSKPVLTFAKEVLPLLASKAVPARVLFRIFQAWSKSNNGDTKIQQRGFTTRMVEASQQLGWKAKNKAKLPKGDFNGADIYVGDTMALTTTSNYDGQDLENDIKTFFIHATEAKGTIFMIDESRSTWSEFLKDRENSEE